MSKFSPAPQLKTDVQELSERLEALLSSLPPEPRPAQWWASWASDPRRTERYEAARHYAQETLERINEQQSCTKRRLLAIEDTR